MAGPFAAPWTLPPGATVPLAPGWLCSCSRNIWWHISDCSVIECRRYITSVTEHVHNTGSGTVTWMFDISIQAGWYFFCWRVMGWDHAVAWRGKSKLAAGASLQLPTPSRILIPQDFVTVSREVSVKFNFSLQPQMIMRGSKRFCWHGLSRCRWWLQLSEHIILSLHREDVNHGHHMYSNSCTIIFFSFGAAAQREPWPPHSWGFLITHNDASQLVGLLWTGDQLVAETTIWQHTTLTTDKHPCLGGIRTHNLSRQAALDLRLRPRGYWDRRRIIRYTNIQTFRNLHGGFGLFRPSSGRHSTKKSAIVAVCVLNVQ